MEVDDTARQVLDALLDDGRADVRELATASGLAPPVVDQRLDGLERSGVITGYEPQLNYAKLGFDLTAVLQLSTAGDDREAVVELLAADDHLVTVYEVSGEYDVFAVGKFPDTAALNDRIGELVGHESVGEVTSSVVLESVVEHEHVRVGGD